MLRKRFICVFVFFLVDVPYNDACSCLPKHRQTMFCESDFVALMTPFNESEYSLDQIQYYVQWNRFYKAPPALQSQTIGRIITSNNPGLCGVQFTPGISYVVSGRYIGNDLTGVDLCNFITLNIFVTEKQRTLLESVYSEGCDCSICDNEFTQCGDLTTSCITNLTSFWCYDDNAACLMDCKGRCSWTNSSELEECLSLWAQ